MRTSTLAFLATGALGVAAQELEIEVTNAVNCTDKTKNGDFINVNYNGTFTDGTAFDSSYTEKGSEPFGFILGAGDVIKGWDMGLLDMCVGDKRKLTVPPQFGYGNETVGPIPPNSVLVFYTELMGIEHQHTL